MAKPTIQTGAHSTLVYRWEDNGWKASPNDSDPKTFGYEANLSAFEGSHNAVELFQPASREVDQWIRENFEGTWTADFTLGNPWWNRSVLDTASTSGSGPYTHTFSGEEPSSMQIVTGNTRSGEDWLIKGAVTANANISVEVTGNVTVSLSGAYAGLEETEPSSQESQVSTWDEVFTFAEASLDVGGTTRRLIQSMEMTIENNTDMVYELGSNEAVDFSPKGRLLTVESVQTRDDQSDEGIDRFLGSGQTVGDPTKNDLVVLFSNGKSGTSKRSLKYDLTSALPNQFSVANTGDPDSEIENTVTNRPVGVTATAENNDSTAI